MREGNAEFDLKDFEIARMSGRCVDVCVKDEA